MSLSTTILANRTTLQHQDGAQLSRELPRFGLGAWRRESLIVLLPDDLCMSMHSSRSSLHVKRIHSESSSKYFRSILLRSSILKRLKISPCKSPKPQYWGMLNRIFSSPKVAFTRKLLPLRTARLLPFGKGGRASSEGSSVKILWLWDLARNFVSSWPKSCSFASLDALFRTPPAIEACPLPGTLAVTCVSFAPVEQQKLELELWLQEEEADFEVVVAGLNKLPSGWVCNCFKWSSIFDVPKELVPGIFGELSSGKLV